MIHSQWITGDMDISIPLNIRKSVFGCAERDEFDDFGMNVVMFSEELPIATGRIYHDGKYFRIDNIGVVSEYRGQRVGDLMTRLLLYKASQFAPVIYINVPEGMEGFFARYGFMRTGAENELGQKELSVAKDEIIYPSKCGGCSH